jgi:hypothetical protein
MPKQSMKPTAPLLELLQLQRFMTGEYNRTISTDRGSPIAGRQAWSGNSEGFITTVVNLPIIFTGERLR